MVRPGAGNPTARTRARKFARARVNSGPCTCALSHTPARARARSHLEANGLRHGAVGRLVSPPGRPSHVRYRANLRAGRGRGAAGALGIRAPRRNDGRALRTMKITARSRTITGRSRPVTRGTGGGGAHRLTGRGARVGEGGATLSRRSYAEPPVHRDSALSDRSFTGSPSQRVSVARECVREDLC